MKNVGKSFDVFSLSTDTLNEISMKNVTRKMAFNNAITFENQR